jgi:hypothetical protein
MYTASATGFQFYMNTTPMDYDTAERMCTLNGGHLANFVSSREQAEVEQHFFNTYYFIPSCHQAYWIGYKAVTWPNFQPMWVTASWSTCMHTTCQHVGCLRACMACSIMHQSRQPQQEAVDDMWICAAQLILHAVVWRG